MEILYKDTAPFFKRPVSAWLLKLPDGKQKLLLCDQNMTFEEVHDICKTHYPGKFTLGIAHVGEMTITLEEGDQMWCPDARRFDQDMRMVKLGTDDPIDLDVPEPEEKS